MTTASFSDLCSVAFGCGLAATVASSGLSLFELVKQRLWPQKARTFTVQLCDEDGFPLRTVVLQRDQFGRLMADLDRYHANPVP